MCVSVVSVCVCEGRGVGATGVAQVPVLLLTEFVFETEHTNKIHITQHLSVVVKCHCLIIGYQCLQFKKVL